MSTLPTPTKTQQRARVLCRLRLRSFTSHCQPSPGPYCGRLHTGSRQWPYPTLRKTTRLPHAAPLQVQGSICVFLKLKGHSPRELPASPSPDSGWHLPWASFRSCSLHHGHTQPEVPLPPAPQGPPSVTIPSCTEDF